MLRVKPLQDITAIIFHQVRASSTSASMGANVVIAGLREGEKYST
jgi:hypothetical protein